MSRRRVRAVILVLGAFGIAAGCGKKGPPLPPLRPVPGPVANLTARRVDGHIELRFTVPATNMDCTSPAAVARVEIYARSAPAESPRPVKEQIVLRENLVATIAVKPPEPDAPKDEKKNEKDESKPVESKPADTRPGAGDPASFVEPVPTAAPLPLPKLTGRAAQAAAAAARAGGAGVPAGAPAGARGPAPGTVIPSRSPEGRAAGAPPGAGAVTPPPGAAGAPPASATGAPPAGSAGAAPAGAAATPDKPPVKVPIPPTRYYWVQAVAQHGQTGPTGRFRRRAARRGSAAAGGACHRLRREDVDDEVAGGGRADIPGLRGGRVRQGEGRASARGYATQDTRSSRRPSCSARRSVCQCDR